MVSDAAATKAPIAKIADKVSGIFVPAVISIALVTTIVWLLIGKPFGYAWRAAFRCWSSAARARWVWRRRSQSWSAAVSARRTAFSSRRRQVLEETGRIADCRARQNRHHHLRRARSDGLLPAAGVSEEELLRLRRFSGAEERASACKGNSEVREERERFTAETVDGISGAARQRPDGELSTESRFAAATIHSSARRRRSPRRCRQQAQTLQRCGQDAALFQLWTESCSA